MLVGNPKDETKLAQKRLKISENMRSRYAHGWQPTCGRCKKYKHFSKIAGNISVDGTWELRVAKYLDSIGVQWERNIKRFDYIRPDGAKIRSASVKVSTSKWKPALR
jgi:hypothetical protein